MGGTGPTSYLNEVLVNNKGYKSVNVKISIASLRFLVLKLRVLHV